MLLFLRLRITKSFAVVNVFVFYFFFFSTGFLDRLAKVFCVSPISVATDMCDQYVHSGHTGKLLCLRPEISWV